MAASTRGVIPSEQRVVLSSTYTLTNATGAQKLFNASTNGAVTLPVGTYNFECGFALTGMNASSGTFGFGFGGNSTISHSWIAIAQKSAALATAATGQITWNAANATALVTASTTTTAEAYIKGTIRVTAVGTVIPQVNLGNAAAAVVQTNSFFKVSPTGSATVTTVGNWS